jgi:phospholipid-binding lipoprotein MlaA
MIIICSLCTLTLLTGCASGPNPIDPYENTNRSIYNFNEGVDRVALKPLADGYVKFIPQLIRASIGNGFDNLAYGNVIANDVLQGKFPQGLGDLGRMAMNSTVGIGGLFDMASTVGLDEHENDFGITLGKWGVKPGPYLVLPILGPSTGRDVPDIGSEIVTNPLTWIYVPVAASIPLGVTDVTDKRSRGEVLAQFRNQAALDPYVFTRDAYLKYRDRQINEGKSAPDQSLYDEDASQPATQPGGNAK